MAFSRVRPEISDCNQGRLALAKRCQERAFITASKRSSGVLNFTASPCGTFQTISPTILTGFSWPGYEKVRMISSPTGEGSEQKNGEENISD